MKTNRFTLLAISTLLGTGSAIAQPSFTPTGVIDMIPTSMSDDASIVVGIGTFGARGSVSLTETMAPGRARECQCSMV